MAILLKAIPDHIQNLKILDLLKSSSFFKKNGD